jgi:hypothetical protein
MSTARTMWERVDLPVLRFVAGCEYAAQWQFNRHEPTDEIPALTGTELDGALRRLEGYGLIRGGRREASGYFRWWRLRPTPDGWRVLEGVAAGERGRHGRRTRGNPAASR